MRPVIRFALVPLVALLVLCLWAEPAMADQPVLVSRRVETVTGVDIARQLASQVTGIEVGPKGATLTLEADGVTRSLGIDLDDAENEGAGGIIGMLGLTSTAAALMRVVGKLGKLFRT